MSLALSQIEIQQFLSDAIDAEFQSQGLLVRGLCPNTKTGKPKVLIVPFPSIHEGMANQKAFTGRHHTNEYL